MTTFATNAAAARVPFGAVTVHRIVAGAYDLWDEMQAWRRARATHATLSALPAHLRHDLGLDGVDLEQIARGLSRR